MDSVNEILAIADLDAAKKRALEILNASTANEKNRTNMTRMVRLSKSIKQLATGMTNHILAHPGENLKVIK